MQWIESVIPCQSACPAHTRIPEYLAAVARGEFDAAYKINLQDNVFSAVLGRVCARPCEAACRHGRPAQGEPLAICFSKRAAADFFAGDPVTLAPLFDQPTGKRVAVIGAGVAGLTAARELARCGHTVIVLEKHARPGGMLNQGIPAFRLPRDIIDREIEQVRRCGVEIRSGVEVGRDVTLTDLLAQHDAVVLAGGTLRRNRLDLPGGDLAGIRHGLDFLLEVNQQRLTTLSGATIVIGGGFTAMDCARAAKRLTSGTVTVCYRRSRHEMLVTPGELEELEREGIPLEEMLAPTGYEGDGDGHVRGVRFVRTALGEPDASGRRRPVPIPGSQCVWPADNVILATGQFPDTSWIDDPLRGQLVGDDGWLKTGGDVRTAHEKLFAAGDFAQGAMSLIDAIGHAKRCAREIDTFLCGTERWGELAVVEQAACTGREPGADRTVRQAMPARPVSRAPPDHRSRDGFLGRGRLCRSHALLSLLLPLGSRRQPVHPLRRLSGGQVRGKLHRAGVGPEPPRRRGSGGTDPGRVLPGAGPAGDSSRRVPSLRRLRRRVSRAVHPHTENHPPPRRCGRRPAPFLTRSNAAGSVA